MVNLKVLLTKLKTRLAKLRLPQSNKNKKLIQTLLVLILSLLVFIVYTLLIVLWMRAPAQATLSSVKASFGAVQNKDLPGAEANLQQAQTSLNQVQKRYRFVSWARLIPFLGGYFKDGYHGLRAAQYGLETADIFFQAIKPYADVLGLEAEDKKLNIQTAEEKIIFILETLDKISPQLDTINQKVTQVDGETSQINPRRYPKTIQGKPVRSQIITIQQSLKDTQESLANIKPLLLFLPKLLGQKQPQRYLLVFQNDAELRPSGGFLTAYAILEVFKGKFTPVLSNDIYNLDARFGNRLPAPEPIKKYLPLVYSWHLRDMNLSPDFTVSMDQFFPNYQAVAGHKDVDGIISIDTQVVVDILKVIGEIGVAAWGRYNAEIVPECNCPQVVYKMEDYATRPTYYIKENRKGMIGPLMHSILLHMMNSPKKLWPQFISLGLNSIKQKHLMFYFPEDQNMQQVADSFNASGRIATASGQLDYFHLNDTNFAGAKSNMYINQEVEQEIDIAADGTITKTVTVIYTNPEPPDDCNLESGGLCLNGFFRDWVRFYVPEGSQLIEMLGSEVEASTAKDLGKTVFEGFFELRPESRVKLIVKYKLPFKHERGKDYKLLIQKQPGTKNHQYTVNLSNQTQEFLLDQDKEISL